MSGAASGGSGRTILVWPGAVLVLGVVALLPPPDSVPVHPLITAEAWLRWLAATLAVLLVPGHLVAARFMTGAEPPARLATAMAAGLLLVVAHAVLADRLHAPFRLASHLLLAAALAIAASRSERWRRLWSGLLPEPSLPAGWWLLVLAVGGALLVTVVHASRDLCVPSGLHDASNHAFLVERIHETSSTRAVAIFAEPFGRPERPYFVGWHAAAALVARAGGLPPYVAMWMQAVACLALLPAALLVVWRLWRQPAAPAALGTLFVLAHLNVVRENLHIGGLGQFHGMIVVPLLVLATMAAARRRSAWLGALAGALVALALRVHASWACLALPLCGIGLVREGTWRPLPWRVLAGFGGGFLVVAGPDVLAAMRDYQQTAMRLQERLTLGEGVDVVLRQLGQRPLMRILTVLGLVYGLVRRRTRPVAVVACAVGLLAVTLRTWQDPVSLALSQPFYRLDRRLLMVMIVLLPPLVAGGVFWLLGGELRSRRRPLAVIATTLILALAVHGGWRDLGLERWLTRQVYCDEDDVRLAGEIGRRLPPGALLANGRLDGSAWLPHLGGRPVLVPAGWTLASSEHGDPYRAYRGLARRRWDSATLDLRALGIDHVLVSDRTPPGADAPALDRRALDVDPRLVPVLTGRNASVYRIAWDGGEPAGPPPR